VGRQPPQRIQRGVGAVLQAALDGSRQAVSRC
jgi:hypothetical protein